MKIALLTIDNREHYHKYDLAAPYFGTAPQALLDGFSMLPDVHVDVVSCIRRPMQSPQQLAENVRYHGVIVPKIGWLTTGYQGCIRAVRRKLRELQPDIVHGQGTERESAICAAWSGHPNVLTIHGNMRLVAEINHARPFSYAWFAARLEAWTIPRSGGVVCITNYTREAVRGRARKTWVVPNAVDASFFDVTSSSSICPPRILCVGTICHRKNQNRLIRALDHLATEREFQLVFLGTGEESDPYVAQFRELIAQRPWCRHEGFANREALKSAFAGASFLILPSLEDNCPMVVLEAMAAGKPVAVARVGGVPDLVEEGMTGTFCDPLVESTMADAVRRLLDDQARAQAMGEAARRIARERFHPRVIATKHLEIYREVLSARS